ncbi:hypothetical protein Tdes44962_MAKER07090 [Teratosphaeria destructans]|uniref:Uncharacterized protein n=1 Tax=Teratosphaeria destructans TaxID=418781 RepID=A0A9W7W6Q3_9PEZI|nr:hypothetical protein Tdes44962_MAKER07090 [Teratosphaeria destructans]
MTAGRATWVTVGDVPGYGHSNPDLLAIQLYAHYLLEEDARYDFTSALCALRHNDPEVFAKFAAHLLNAAVISRAEVRTYDIALWYGKGLPEYVLVPLRNLCAYYHKEVKLQGDLAFAEDRVEEDLTHTIESWEGCSDYEYAYRCAKRGTANYGFETTSSGYAEFAPRFKGRQQLKWILAALEARLVRLEFAGIKERHGHLMWSSGRNVDLKVWLWVMQAGNFIRARTEESPGETRQEKAMAAFRLTADEKRDVYDNLLLRLSNALAQLGARKTDVEELQSRRAVFKQACDALQVEDHERGADKADKSPTVDELRNRVEQQIEVMVQRYGERQVWDWEMEQEGSEDGEIRDDGDAGHGPDFDEPEQLHR